jgi:hypothetical protein
MNILCRQITSKEINKTNPKTFPRRQVVTSYPKDTFAGDLVDVSSWGKYNRKGRYEITFLLVVVDVYSRYAWVEPLISKDASHVLKAFEKINNFPTNLWTDEGKEFYNSYFKTYCVNHHINLYNTTTQYKSVYAERFNRTLRLRINQYMAEHNTEKYIDALPTIVKEYNERIHRSINARPIDVYNENINRQASPYFYDDIEPKIKIGDYVRISFVKKIFEKGTAPNWSREIFKIVAKDESNQIPIMFWIEDLTGERIGKFYPQELQKTELRGENIHYKELDTTYKPKQKTVNRQKFYFVNFKGWDKTKFSIWVNENRYQQLKRGEFFPAPEGELEYENDEE